MRRKLPLLTLAAVTLFAVPAFAQDTVYQYDQAGHLTRIIYPNGQNISYAYGSDGRLSATVQRLSIPDGGFGDEDAEVPDTGVVADGGVNVDGGANVDAGAPAADGGASVDTGVTGGGEETDEGCGCATLSHHTSSRIPGLGLLLLGAGLLATRARPSRRRRLFGLVLAAGLLLPNVSQAHVVNPLSIILYVAEGSDVPTAVFNVRDQATCSAHIVATTGNAAIATVTPVMIDAITADFTVSAGTTPGTTTINVQWVGETAPNPPCADVAGNVVTVEVRPRPGRNTGESNPASGVTGDPVNTLTGELVFDEEPDLDLGGPMPLVFQRYFGSKLRLNFIVGEMGDNWRHSFEWRIHTIGNVLYVVNNKGKVQLFLKLNNVWVLQTATDTPYQVIQNPGEFIVGDPFGERIYRFDAGGQLIEVLDGKGNVHTLSYTANRLTSVSDGLGRTLTLSYTANKVSGVSDGTRNVSFTYTGEELTGATDPLFQSTGYEYDQVHPDPALMTRRVRPKGNAPYTQTYDSLGRVGTQTDAFGNVWTLTYASNTTTVNQPGLNLYSHVHNAMGELTQATDAAGNMIMIGNDGSGRRTMITDRSGGISRFSYDTNSGRITSGTDALGNMISMTMTPRTHATGVVFQDQTAVTYPDGTSEAFVYDAAGNLTSYSDRGGNAWTLTYNSRGQPLTVSNPLGGVTTYTYNANQTLASVTDPAGHVTGYEYDAQRHQTAVVLANGERKSETWDLGDRRTSRTDERGGVTSYGYDANGNRTTITDPLGNVVTTSYDLMDRITSVEDAAGNTVSFRSDALGRLDRFSNRAGQTLDFTIDGAGAVSAFSDRAGNAWSSTFDDDQRLTSVTDAAGNTTGYSYDAAGQLTARTSGAGNADGWSYDTSGRIASTVDGLGQATAYSYDGSGRVAGVTTPGGYATMLQRNALGRVVRVTGPAADAWQYSYDSSGNLSTRSDPLGNTWSYTVDPLNRLATTTFPASLGSMTLTRDEHGNITRRAFSDGKTHDFSFDANNRMTTANGLNISYDARSSISVVNGINVGRDVEQRITTLELATGKTITYAYDSAGRVSSISDWAGGTIGFSYDNRDLPATITRSNGVTTTLTWNGERALVGSSEGTLASYTLQRDARGNTVRATRNVPIEAVVSEMSKSVGFDLASQTMGYSYDAAGNLLDDGKRSYSWNLAGTMTQYDEAGAVSFSYDAIGLPITRDAAGVTDTFVWNYAFTLPAISVLRRGGTDLRYFVHAPDGTLLYAIEAADDSRHFFHFDEVGNTLFLSDDAGAISDRYAYSPFGEMLASMGNFERLFTFGGRYGVMQEGSTGLYIMRKRWYDAVDKRFLSREPRPLLFDPLKVDPYQFVRGNPLRFVDPTGEDATQVVADTTTYGGAAADAVANVADLAAKLGRRIESAGLANGGSKLASGASWAGVAGTAISDVNELVKLNDALDEVEKGLLQRSEIIWRRYDMRVDELRKLRAGKNPISLSEYRRRLNLLGRMRDRELEESRDEAWNDSVNAGYIYTSNVLINAVPFGGVAIENVYNFFK